MITAIRNGNCVSHNVSYFKKTDSSIIEGSDITDEDDDENSDILTGADNDIPPTPINTCTRKYPIWDRRPTQLYEHDQCVLTNVSDIGYLPCVSESVWFLPILPI